MAKDFVAELSNASLHFGARQLWDKLNLQVKPGEFIAVLGPNGSGKSSLLKVLLGMYQLSEGRAVAAKGPGYIPQHGAFNARLPLTGYDLVRLGLEGGRWGLGSAADTDQQVERALERVGATVFAHQPIAQLSGGQQQRLRIAQAVVANPQLLLCDEPLLSLDVASQQQIGELINVQRQAGAAVIFVTHEINPVLPYVDRVLYLVGGKWRLGTADQVLTTETLSELYGTTVDVIRVRGRIVVVAGGNGLPTEPTDSHHHKEHA